VCDVVEALNVLHTSLLPLMNCGPAVNIEWAFSLDGYRQMWLVIICGDGFETETWSEADASLKY
jgi:hypothetical protein